MLVQSLPPDTVKTIRDPLWHNTPLEALLDFHYETGSPQAAPFLQMLIAHGVNINTVEKNDKTLLQSAIQQGKKTVGAMAYRIGSRYQLLDAGTRASIATIAKRGNGSIPFGRHFFQALR